MFLFIQNKETMMTTFILVYNSYWFTVHHQVLSKVKKLKYMRQAAFPLILVREPKLKGKTMSFNELNENMNKKQSGNIWPDSYFVNLLSNCTILICFIERGWT